MAEVPTTELEAVNEMLFAIGESPINTLNEPGFVDAQLAIAQLRRVSREVQSSGWQFNTEAEFKLSIDLNNNIIIPNNAVDVQASGASRTRKITVRNGKLYDLEKHTFTFTDTVETTIIFFLPFTDLPEPARNYITIKAARRFQDKTLGANENHTYDKEDEEAAERIMKHSEHANSRYNMITSNPAMARVNRHRRRF